ncbi:MAG: ubiquinone biosynthesis protein [Zetaproteobacteria bacterium]|nr:MAG: ubiquinone biosynthesis protein [Zetaproteobacteria bacterium]
MNKTYDVMIVGAGVIGSALALALSKQGYSIALLDIQSPSFAPTNPERVIALSEGSKRYLESLDVWDAVLAHGAGWIKHIAVREPNNIGVLDMSHQELDSDALGYVLEIRHVVEPLHQALAQYFEQVDMIFPAQCLAINQDEAGVSLHIKTKSGEQTLQASLLVGADGTNSFVRKQAGILTSGWDHNRMGLVASVSAGYGHGDTAYECFREEGPLALLPLADGRFSIVWSVAPKTAMELLKLDDAGFLNMLKTEAGDAITQQVGGFKAVGKRASFPLELRIAKQFAKANVVLLGNAAHTIHPIAGQGMNLGLRDVAVLADVLAQVWAKGDLRKSLIGQTYAERRRLDTLAVAGFTEAVLEAFATPASSLSPKRWLRGTGLNTMETMPALKHLLLEQAAGLGQIKGLSL